MANTYTLIQAKTLDSAVASVEFTSIPQTYTDIKLVMSTRTTNSAGREQIFLYPNGSTSNNNRMVLYGFDGTTVAGGGGTDKFLGWQTGGGAIASAFSNIDVYFPNYASSNYKSYSADLVAENNSSSAYILNLMASSWSDATAISSIQILCETHSFAVNSSFYLYGISKT